MAPSMHQKQEAAERATFSDFDDSGGEREKKRVKKTHRTTTTTTAAPRRRTTSSSLVGKRKVRAKRRPVGRAEESDDEEERPEATLPDYLKSRRRDRTTQQQKGGDHGLLLPPKHEDVNPLPHLETKPNLSGVTPPRPYENIKLSHGGVIPASIAQFLKPYQVEGTEWLFDKFIRQKGALLGDDMGLGKTIQVISFLAAAFGKTGDERDHKRMRRKRKYEPDAWYPRVIIVCPGTLIENWKAELDRWGYWHIYLYHGGAAAKEAALAAAESGMLEIMITTYDTYKRDESAINCVSWDCVIADECHIIKERKSQNAQAMNNINALCRIGLSGTAIQNKYEELWTLLNWANPGSVSTIASWKSTICVPLKIGQSHDATNSQLAKARRTAANLSNNLLPHFFKRRTKALIAHQLPKKSDRVVFCPLTETQVAAYQNFTDSELVHAIRDSAEPCFCGSGKKQGSCCREQIEGFGEWRNHVFPALVTLQKLSNHVALMVPKAEADAERLEKDLDRLKVALPETWKDMFNNRDNLTYLAQPEFCGKWNVLKQLMKLWHDNGDKVLIFSHSVKLLNILKLLLMFKTTYNIAYLDGSMSYFDRQKEVNEFNSSPTSFVFLISTKAGGVGLNITSANKVVVVDPNWNPAYDLQAQDRAYRIGQTRDVEVFRLVSVGTVEEIVYARQIYKQQQANIGYNASVERRYFKGVQDDKDHKGEIFGLANLFAPQQENVVLRDIVNKTNVAETRAGVEVAGLDLEASMEDEDDFVLNAKSENAAMEAIAAELVGGQKVKPKKKDPVQAILASAGVAYTHENAEVIGTSKIETKLSSRAQKGEDDPDHINEFAFARSQQSQRAMPPNAGTGYQAVYGDGGEGEEVRVKYKYRPPEEVKRRQFCAMADYYKYDVSDFALVVEGWTQQQRRDCLEHFYRQRRAALAGV
ncbi:putative helicase, P-loop containing nucleoside triphosphate hydrolase, SNF2-like domain superfamily [Septoria linicola]|nr:putative helicase, P-loop containing nucleoside triphosphate hydrolase, SNF2-like domain superfamily [Septoria linicola]